MLIIGRVYKNKSIYYLNIIKILFKIIKIIRKEKYILENVRRKRNPSNYV